MASLAAHDLAHFDPSRLSEGDRRIYEDLEKSLIGEPLERFIERVTPKYPAPAHVQPLIDILTQARVQPVRACVSMPPRHAKSETLFNGLAWWMRYAPADTHAYVSYSDDQATSQSRKIRQRAIEGGVVLSREMRNLGEWRTNAGGGLFAAGVEGGLTGKGVSGLALIDDPYKGINEASSAKTRELVWNWFNGTLMARLEHASVIVVHTRWHEADLIGRLRKEGWVVINLPALAEADDPLGRAAGEPLWPKERPLEGLLEKKKLDAFTFEAMYQGRPRPRGHAVFAREPARFDLATFQPEGFRILLAADPAATDDTTGDFSALAVLAVKGEGAERIGYVIDFFRRQITVPAFADTIMRFQSKHGDALAGIEAVGGFKALPQMLRAVRPGIRLLEISPIGDKFTRAQPVATAWNEGRILVPTSAPWLADFLEEVMIFTGVHDDHDDQVDALAHAWNMAGDTPKGYAAPKGPQMKWRR